MKWYIYGLYKNNDENDIFYIGRSRNPAKRIIDHRQKFPYYVFDCRIQFVTIDEIDCESIEEIDKLETYWIQQFHAWGFKLSNYNLKYGFDVRHLLWMNDIDNNRESIGRPFVETAEQKRNRIAKTTLK